MARTTVSSADQAFDHFLAAHERQPERINKVYVYPNYKAMGSEAACRAFNRRMEDATCSGAVDIRWEKRGSYIASACLADAAKLYEFLGRTPPDPNALSHAALAMLDYAQPCSNEERLGWIEIAMAVEADWPADMLGSLVAELKRIRAVVPDQPAFIISAAGPLASSKLLDKLPRAALRRIGVPTDAYPPPPMVLLTAGAAEPEAVVLVENPRAFERAFAATRVLPVAWVSTHGLVATSIADALGGRRYGAPVDGSPPPLERLLAARNLFYWGDLDLAGLMIFAEARKRLPQLRLSALYRPMLDLLARGGGHPYTIATDKVGQRAWDTDDAVLRPLIEACANCAVDQEWVPSFQITACCLDPI